MDILLNAIKEDDGGAKKKGARPGAATTATAGVSVEVRAYRGFIVHRSIYAVGRNAGGAVSGLVGQKTDVV